MTQPMPQRRGVINRAAAVLVWAMTMRAAIDCQHPEPVVLGLRRANVHFNLGAGAGVGGRDPFL